MHVLKNKIVLALLVSVFAFMAGCAGSSGGSSQESPETAATRDAKVKAQEADKLAMLESMFTVFKESVKNRAPSDILLDFLTDPSEAWLDELESHAKSYDAAAMDTCQFYEAYAIVLYRLFEREHLWDVTDYRMLYLLLYNSGFLDLVDRVNMGPFEVKNDRGSVGLAKSPKVPIMLFTWDDTKWKLDLIETLPLITKGIEATAAKKNWTGAKLALYWLDKKYHLQYSRLDESLFEPIGF
ncbi:hypothetical protein [Fibrobacter succinogenes]|uniref:hypothetical protein n=1 Tax=Fibrobacter succinogenes TaxID=833 RepID=UPI00156A4100|nr:hypothetical protein [Fibrobacter succinogenes]